MSRFNIAVMWWVNIFDCWTVNKILNRQHGKAFDLAFRPISEAAHSWSYDNTNWYWTAAGDAVANCPQSLSLLGSKIWLVISLAGITAFELPPVFRHCWLGNKKGIQPAKTCSNDFQRLVIWSNVDNSRKGHWFKKLRASYMEVTISTH